MLHFSFDNESVFDDSSFMQTILFLMDRPKMLALPMSYANRHVIGNGDLCRKAWAIRKQWAAKFGVPVLFVRWRSALKAALGQRVKPVDAYRAPLGCIGSRVNAYLLSSEAPLVISLNSVVESVPKANRRLVQNHMSYLVKIGAAENNHGNYYLRSDRRPYQAALVS